jgi:excisionase family DNA binding protein
MARRMNEPSEPLQIPINEVARLLSYNARTVRRLVERGELEAVGQGKLRRIVTASIHAYQQRNRVGMTPGA